METKKILAIIVLLIGLGFSAKAEDYTYTMYVGEYLHIMAISSLGGSLPANMTCNEQNKEEKINQLGMEVEQNGPQYRVYFESPGEITLTFTYDGYTTKTLKIIILEGEREEEGIIVLGYNVIMEPNMASLSPRGQKSFPDTFFLSDTKCIAILEKRITQLHA